MDKEKLIDLINDYGKYQHQLGCFKGSEFEYNKLLAYCNRKLKQIVDLVYDVELN